MYGAINEFKTRVNRLLFHWRYYWFVYYYVVVQACVIYLCVRDYNMSQNIEDASTFFGPGNLTKMNPSRLTWYDPKDDPPNDCSTFSVEDWKTKEWLCLNGTRYLAYDQLYMAKVYFRCRQEETNSDCERVMYDEERKRQIDFMLKMECLLILSAILYRMDLETTRKHESSETQREKTMEELKKWRNDLKLHGVSEKTTSINPASDDEETMRVQPKKGKERGMETKETLKEPLLSYSFYS